MAQNSKNKNTLKKLPFYSEEIKVFKKNNKKISNISLFSELQFFPKNLKNYLINSYQINYHSHQKEKKD